MHDYLVISDFWHVIINGVGNWIYDFSSGILNGCYEAYSTLGEFDFLQNISVKALLNNLDSLVYSVFFVIFIVAVFCKLFKIDNPLKVLANAFIVFIVAVAFSTLLTMGVNMKNATIKDIDIIVNSGDYQISETIYAQNTVDVLRSLKAGEIVHLSTAQMKYFVKDEVIKKAYLIDRPKVDENTGEIVYEDLPDGIIGVGWGELRYYRYHTDFMTVNCIIIASVIVYVLAMLKHCFLLVDWFLINVFGKFALGRAFFSVDNMGKVMKSIVNNLVAQVILYAMMSIFSIYMNSVMLSEVHWIFKTLLIYAFGISVFVGSNFITKGLGIEDNFGKVASGFFAGRMIARGTRKGYDKLKEKASTFADAGTQIMDKVATGSYNRMSESYQNRMEQAMQSEEFKNAMHEGKRDDDIREAKEEMLDKDYEKEIREQAKKELYGNDYKIQEEKDRILNDEEKKKINDQAMRELHGDNYRLDEEKQKLIQKDENSKLTDQAKKELYGDDYKIQEEKDKILNSEEKKKINDQAMRELYGDDYKYQEVKSDVIRSEERAEMVDKAKVELHGEDYKQRKMRREAEDYILQQEMREEVRSERTLEKMHHESFESYRELSDDEITVLLNQLKDKE